MSVQRPVITVFGAGLAGTLCAVRFARLGYKVELYERRADPRVAGAAGGRSINLALSTRGIEALREMGLADEVLADGILMRGRAIHPLHGDLAFQPYSSDEQKGIYSISRGGLNETLLNAASNEPNINITFSARCTSVDLDTMHATIEDQRPGGSGVKHTKKCEVIIGGDGAFSAVRSSMMKRDRFDYHQYYQTHGYKELEIPPAENESGLFGKFRINPNALHIWPRRSYMMIALPNADGSFTCTLFAPFEGEHGFDRVKTRDDARRYFEKRFPDAIQHMPTLLDDFERNPVSSLVTVKCFPWTIGGKVALIGDAAHAVVPFYGQGMNASFEDVHVLGECSRSISRAASPRATRSRTSPSTTSSRCATMSDRRPSAARSSSSTGWRAPSRTDTCRSTRWSHSRRSPITRRSSVRACRTSWCSRLWRRSSRSPCSSCSR